MKRRVAQFVMVLCGFGILISLMFPRIAGGERSKIATARTETFNLRAALNQYQIEFGEYPHGENGSILKALLGNNAKKIRFFDANPKRFNSRGEFLDPWKTPYKIQIIGNTNFAIRSPGADRVFGSQDDITNSAQ
jgi:hypothetical protein